MSLPFKAFICIWFFKKINATYLKFLKFTTLQHRVASLWLHKGKKKSCTGLKINKHPK